jgi:hypothetical protein
MKEIRLSNSTDVALVDDEDYDELNRWTWRKSKKGRAVRSYRIKGKRIQAFMHRTIINAPDGVKVDHIDGNGTNNVRSNLRLATGAENCQNARKIRKASSQYKGVYFCEPGAKPWRARIQYFGKRITIGSFASEVEAAQAWDAAARQYHGCFARLNFPKSGEQPKPMDGTDSHTFGEE